MKDDRIRIKERPDCLKCRYFYVTWDKKHPRGCRAMGFKTNMKPSVVVYQSSGQECMMFMPKNGKIP